MFPSLRFEVAAPVLLVIAQVASCGGDAAVDRGDLQDGAPFREAAAEAGLRFVQRTGFDGRFLFPEVMTGGVGLLDADGDGDLDVYLVDGGAFVPEPRGGDDRLFLNDGAARFEDVTARSGIVRRGYGQGLAVGDHDGDGAVDLYLSSFGPDQHYVNRGGGAFAEVEGSAVADGWSTSATFFDYDRDGDLDLWVCRYVAYDPTTECSDLGGALDYCGPSVFPGVSDVLLENDGSGGFRDVSAERGIAEAASAGLGVVTEDFDLDGHLDVYVANDDMANHLWVNRAGAGFDELGMVNGVAFNLHGDAEASMGVLCEDLDGDLRPDLFLTHLRHESHTLYQGMGSARGFRDATGPMGLGGTTIPATGFGVGALDADLDGDLDLVVANGAVASAEVQANADLPTPWQRYAEEDAYLENVGGAFAVPRPLGGVPLVGRGLAVGDLDGDGDEDVVVNSLDAPARLLLNGSDPAGGWVRLDLRDGPGPAVGARVVVRRGGEARVRTVRSGGSYCSAKDPRWTLALPGDAGPLEVEVTWLGGSVERFLLETFATTHVLRRGTTR